MAAETLYQYTYYYNSSKSIVLETFRAESVLSEDGYKIYLEKDGTPMHKVNHSIINGAVLSDERKGTATVCLPVRDDDRAKELFKNFINTQIFLAREQYETICRLYTADIDALPSRKVYHAKWGEGMGI